MSRKVQYGVMFILVYFCVLIFGIIRSAEARTIWRLQDTYGRKWGIDIDENLIRGMDLFPMFKEKTGSGAGNSNFLLECRNSINSVLEYNAFTDSGVDKQQMSVVDDMEIFQKSLQNKNGELISGNYQRIEKNSKLLQVLTNLAFVENKWEMNKQNYRIASIDRVEMINILSGSEEGKWVAIFHMKIRDAKSWLAPEYTAVIKVNNEYYVMFATPKEW